MFVMNIAESKTNLTMLIKRFEENKVVIMKKKAVLLFVLALVLCCFLKILYMQKLHLTRQQTES